jgi:large subunit ribosomal protein L28
MSRICSVCGKHPVAGRKITRRGLAKKKGGVGRRITGVAKRRFMPNLQNVRVLVKGKAHKMLVCVSCLKAGKVTKAA